MSAFEEFSAEKHAIDTWLAQGYLIVGVADGLEGTDVQFEKGGASPEQSSLRLLTADARKYVSSVIFEKRLAEKR